MTGCTKGIALPPGRLSIGITGHRGGNTDFAANQEGIKGALIALFNIADRVAARQAAPTSPTRLLSPLAQGSDMMAARLALDMGWTVCAPLPFGLDLNIAINLDSKKPEKILTFLNDESGCKPGYD